MAAYKETGDDDVQIIAVADGVEGIGTMEIKFPSPTVASYQPSACGGTGVCVGSVPSIEFSVAMNVASLSQNSYLFECPVEKDDKTDCAFTDAEISKAQKLTALALPPAANAITKKLVYALTPPQNVKLNTRYRVVIADGARSTAEKKFSAFNYPYKQPKYCYES